MRLLFSTFALLVTLAVAQRAGSAPPTVLHAEPDAKWNAVFDNPHGWVGGDGAYSVEISPTRVLWFFGDTLLGDVKNAGRPGALMVNNTIGIQNRPTDGIDLKFFNAKDAAGKPVAVFIPADGKGWFWPQAAVAVGPRVFLFLPQIDKSHEPGVLGFKQIAQWMAVIENPADAPDSWRVAQHPIPFARFGPAGDQSWGSAVVADGDFLYNYGYEDKTHAAGKRRLLVARAPKDKLLDFNSWRFHTANGWTETAADAAPLADGMPTEFSVSPAPNHGGYVLVYTDGGLSDRILGRFAPAPVGPWSEPVVLYVCPEMRKDKGVFSYAAKAHPWAAAGNELLVTYCVNTWDFGRLFRDDAVYRPRAVRVTLGQPKN